VVGILLATVLLVVVAVTVALYRAPETLTRLLVDVGRRAARLERTETTLPGGLRYAFLEGGRGEPLMLLHGFGGTKDNFVAVARFLTRHFRVIIPDQVGFAESSHPDAGDYSSAGQAANLRALAQSLGIGRLHLGGNSMGGQIALVYAAQYPGEVASLWVLDPGGLSSAPPSQMTRTLAAGGRNPYLIESVEQFADMIRFVMARPPRLPRPVLEELARDGIRHRELQERIFGAIRADSVEGRVAGLPTPALIVWGERDPVWHVAGAAILHGLLPNSRVVIMPDLGHVPMIEAPRQCARDYLQFRRSLAGSC
jgi:pimeloyl-ACP methyl ester carboxylesterase